jgi:hypothetical protein
MINLPSNWLKRVQVRELPHDPSIIVLLLNFTNDHNQYFRWYQTINAKHGLTAASKLEEGLSLLGHIDLELEDPYINATSREKAEALDQHWQQVTVPNTLNLKDFRAKHGLRDPEEVNRD